MDKYDWILFYLLSAYLNGVVLFLSGYFPVDLNKINLPPRTLQPERVDLISLNHPKKPISKCVFMVIDALRYNFITEEQMPYSNKLCKIQLETSAPTVTLPRVKSLTSGTESNYIDVVMNVIGTPSLQDSILHRLYAEGNKIVFYGDYIWVKLFSNLFERYKSSLDQHLNFVEFYEVDSNVTANLRSELKNLSGWDFMTLHYTGLDRIGHIEGSKSTHLYSKLWEMDSIIKEVDTNLSTSTFRENSLLIVTADHGMHVDGSHGGSSHEERFVPLIINRPDCSDKEGHPPEYKQIDVAATLAMLFDVPLPSTSIGCVIPEMLYNVTDEDVLYMLYYNSRSLMEKMVHKFGAKEIEHEEYYDWYRAGAKAHIEYLVSKRTNNSSSQFLFITAKHNYMRSARYISNLLASTYTMFDYTTITMGVIVTSYVTILILLRTLTNSSLFWKFPNKQHLLIMIVAAFVICILGYICNFFQFSGIFQVVLITITILNILVLHVEILKVMFGRRLQVLIDVPLSVAFLILFQTFSYVSTSFIEEEHQTWYYLGPTFVLYLILRNVYTNRIKMIIFNIQSFEEDIILVWKVLRPIRRAFFTVALTIFIRRLNQTGDKWLSLPDVADWFAMPENKTSLSVYVAISLILLVLQLKSFNSPLQQVACVLSCLCIYCYRGVVGSVVFFNTLHFNPFLVLPVYWICIATILVKSYATVLFGNDKYIIRREEQIRYLLGSHLTAFALISALLHKPHNVFLVFGLHYSLRWTFNICDNLRTTTKGTHDDIILVYKVASTICISKMFFFFQGNSNNLGTIDLSSGFIGLTQYNLVITALLVGINTFFSDIYGFLWLLQNIYQSNTSHTSLGSLDVRYRPQEKENYHKAVSLMAGMKFLTTSVYLAIMISFRQHLFIFTVFSPKMLYESATTLVFYLCVVFTNLYFSFLNKILEK